MIRAHQHAAGARGADAGTQALGHGRGRVEQSMNRSKQFRRLARHDQKRADNYFAPLTTSID